MDKRIVFRADLMHMASAFDEAIAEVTLPAMPYVLQDAMERAHLDDGEPMFIDLTDYTEFPFLEPYLEDANDLYALNRYSSENGLFAEIRSFAVLDYLKAMLSEGEDGYNTSADVLCAADFGTPQKRMRFIMVGIKKRISSTVTLPHGNLDESQYCTVHDAISDLEDIEPYYDIDCDNGIVLNTGHAEMISDLGQYLRDSKIVMNHIVTRTTEVAMQRFKALRQGENFHALDSKLIENTYTDATRTQNTIYLRLDYSQPSGTVLNVRKSMWIHPVKDRAISIREAARLQTFPDSFVFIGSKDKQYQQVGNAVPPIMAKAIAEHLSDQLKPACDMGA